MAATSATDAWAVGSYLGVGFQAFILHWDGSDWTESPKEMTHADLLYDVAATSGDDAWAVGSVGATPIVLHWDGTIWRRIPTPPGVLYANDVIALSSTDVWVVGGPGSLHWDGTDWAVVPMADGGILNGVDAVAPDDLWAVGYQDVFQPLIEHYDGQVWSVVDADPPPGGNDNILYDVAASSPSDAWSVGSFGTIRLHPLAEHWDGNGWSQFQLPESDGMVDFLFSATAVSGSDMWAAGLSKPNDDYEAPFVEHWDGTAWRQIKPALPPGGGSFASITAASSEDIWAVGGYYQAVGNSPRPLIEHLHGC